MVFYETVHAGIIRCNLNEQYVWSWFRKNKIDPPTDIHSLCHLIEGALNEWNWDVPLILNAIISREYYKWWETRKNMKILD